MRTVQAGKLKVRALGGSDGSGGGDGPALLLCHGYGAPGDDLVSLSRAIDAGPGVRWFFPEAPLAIDVGMGTPGRAWWNIDMMAIQRAMMSGGRRDFSTSETPAGMTEARSALAECVDSLIKEQAVDPARLVVGGFSQGAMITTDLAVTRAHPYAGLVILSGALVDGARWKSALERSGKDLRVLQSHGRQDPLLPFDVAESLRNLLVASGATVEWSPFNGQHEIPMAVLDRIGPFARARFGT